MLKNPSMDSGLLRIKSKTLPVVDKSPKPLQPHLLCSSPCSLLASGRGLPSDPGRGFVFLLYSLCIAVTSAWGTSSFLQVCTWLTPLVTEAQLKHHFLSEAFLALPNQIAPRPFCALCLVSPSCCSQLLLLPEVILFCLFTYLSTLSHVRLYIPDKQGPFLSHSSPWLQHLTQSSVNICYMNGWFLNRVHSHLPILGQILDSVP